MISIASEAKWCRRRRSSGLAVSNGEMDRPRDGLAAVRLVSEDAFCLDEATYTNVPGSVSIAS